MSARVVAVAVAESPGPGPALTAALLEDVVDLVADTPEVAGALLVPAGRTDAALAAAWPDTPLVETAADATLAEQLSAVRGLASAAVAVVVADAPDLPTLLLGKLFSALAGPPVLDAAVCPAGGGGLVAAAIPVTGPAPWLAELDVRLDDPDALTRLQAAAPARALAVGSGWHRVRSRADLDRLDPGLEGWDATRALRS